MLLSLYYVCVVIGSDKTTVEGIQRPLHVHCVGRQTFDVCMTLAPVGNAMQTARLEETNDKVVLSLRPSVPNKNAASPHFVINIPEMDKNFRVQLFMLLPASTFLDKRLRRVQ